MTRQEQERRALVRIRRRRARRARRMVFSVLGVILLVLLAYGLYGHIRIKRLQGQISQLQQQLKDSDSDKKSLKKELKELQQQLDEKEAQLQKDMEATYNDPEKPNVYLTFDDGPSSNTDTILDTLADNNIRATFFCIGQTGEDNEKRYRRIVEEGHTLGMHSYTHEYKTVYANLASFQEDVIKISDYLYQVTGIRSKYYRFPGGSSNTVSKVDMKECIKYLNENQIKYFDWNAQNDDATGKKYTADQLVTRAVDSVKSSGENVVLLMHDEKTKTATAEALPELISRLKEAGYDLLPITDETPLVQHVSYDSVD